MSVSTFFEGLPQRLPAEHPQTFSVKPEGNLLQGLPFLFRCEPKVGIQIPFGIDLFKQLVRAFSVKLSPSIGKTQVSLVQEA